MSASPSIEPDPRRVRAALLGKVGGSPDMAALGAALARNYSGQQVGVYRENDDLIPIMSRAPADERESVEGLPLIQVPTTAGTGSEVTPIAMPPRCGSSDTPTAAPRFTWYDDAAGARGVGQGGDVLHRGR